MFFSLNRHRNSTKTLMDGIDAALNTGNVPQANTDLRTLVADHGMEPDVGTFLQTRLDRIETEDAALRPRRPESDESMFRFKVGLDRAIASARQDSLFGGGYSGYVPKNNSEMAIDAVASGLIHLADKFKRDKDFIPVFNQLIDLLADRHLAIAQETAQDVIRIASPKWLGDIGVPEDMTLTGFYKLKQPLKRAAMHALLRIADKAMTKGNFDIAERATYGAEEKNARELENINSEAREKRAIIQSTRPKQLRMAFDAMKPA